MFNCLILKVVTEEELNGIRSQKLNIIQSRNKLKKLLNQNTKKGNNFFLKLKSFLNERK